MDPFLTSVPKAVLGLKSHLHCGMPRPSWRSHGAMVSSPEASALLTERHAPPTPGVGRCDKEQNQVVLVTLDCLSISWKCL